MTWPNFTFHGLVKTEENTRKVTKILEIYLEFSVVYGRFKTNEIQGNNKKHNNAL